MPHSSQGIPSGTMSGPCALLVQTNTACTRKQNFPSRLGGDNMSQETPGRASGNREGTSRPSRKFIISRPHFHYWVSHYHLLPRVHIRGMATTSCRQSPNHFLAIGAIGEVFPSLLKSPLSLPPQV